MFEFIYLILINHDNIFLKFHEGICFWGPQGLQNSAIKSKYLIFRYL